MLIIVCLLSQADACANRGEGGGHNLWSFKWIIEIINSLPQGTYVWDSSKLEFVPAN